MGKDENLKKSVVVHFKMNVYLIILDSLLKYRFGVYYFYC